MGDRSRCQPLEVRHRHRSEWRRERSRRRRRTDQTAVRRHQHQIWHRLPATKSTTPQSGKCSCLPFCGPTGLICGADCVETCVIMSWRWARLLTTSATRAALRQAASPPDRGRSTPTFMTRYRQLLTISRCGALLTGDMAVTVTQDAFEGWSDCEAMDVDSVCTAVPNTSSHAHRLSSASRCTPLCFAAIRDIPAQYLRRPRSCLAVHLHFTVAAHRRWRRWIMWIRRVRPRWGAAGAQRTRVRAFDRGGRVRALHAGSHL